MTTVAEPATASGGQPGSWRCGSARPVGYHRQDEDAEDAVRPLPGDPERDLRRRRACHLASRGRSVRRLDGAIPDGSRSGADRTTALLHVERYRPVGPRHDTGYRAACRIALRLPAVRGASGKDRSDAAALPRWRRAAAILVVIPYVLAMWIGFLGLVDLPAGFVGPGRSHVIDGSYGALIFIVIPAGFLAQVHPRSERVAGVQQIWVAALALAVAGLLATEYRYLALAAAVGFGGALLVALHADRGRFLRMRRGSPILGALAGLGTLPWLWLAWRMASNARGLLPPRDAETNRFHHWTAAGALAICVVLLVWLASAKTRGWCRLPAVTAAVAGSVYGLSSLLYPHDAGSGGRTWGGLTMTWCVIVAISALYKGNS